MSQSEEESDGKMVDDEVIDFLTGVEHEDNMITEYGLPDSNDPSQEKISVVRDWLPEGENWQGKTIIHPRQAQALAAARILPEVFPALDGIEDELIAMINNYEQYLTSIDGRAREQQTSILQSLFGIDKEVEESRGLLYEAARRNMENGDGNE